MLIMSMKEKVDSQHYIWEQDQQRISLNYPVSLFSKTLLVILATLFIIDAASAAYCPPLCPPENSKGKDTVSSESARCPTVCNPMNRSMPGLSVYHQLPDFT